MPNFEWQWLIRVFLFQIPPALFCKEQILWPVFPPNYFPFTVFFFFSALKKQLSTEVPLPVKHCQEACRQPAMGGMGQELANRPLALIHSFQLLLLTFFLFPHYHQDTCCLQTQECFWRILSSVRATVSTLPFFPLERCLIVNSKEFNVS